MADIDWTDENAQVTEHFTVGDALMLHNWNRLATEDDGANFDQITSLCQKMEEIRTILGVPMRIHCMFRSKAYNIEQKILLPTGADVHSQNLAVDFDAGPDLTTDQVKARLMPMLETLGIRMENNGMGASWIHLDTHPVGHARFFLP